MRKLICGVAVLAMCVASSAFAQETLEVRIVDANGDAVVDVAANDMVDVRIEGRLNTTSSDGLALWGVNLTDAGTYGTYDLCTETSIVEGASMSQFVRNQGLTNPAGYGGTCNGMGGLWQIGGGQNTIGNTGPTAFPIGTVDIGVANGTGWTVLAQDTVTVPADFDAGDTIVLTLDTCFANTIDAGQAGPVYAVSAANCTIAGSLTLQFAGGCQSTAACPNTDVNCDNVTSGLDIAIITNSANFGLPVGSAANPRADVNGDGTVSGLDVAAAQSSACFGM